MENKMIFCSSNTLLSLNISDEKYACWFHIEAPKWNSFERVIRHLAVRKCALIQISGINCEDYHDRVDDIIIETGKDGILTTWCNESLETATENYIYMGYNFYETKIISVIGEKPSDELKCLCKVSKNIQKIENL